jgi:predicted glutamine amidotransferase
MCGIVGIVKEEGSTITENEFYDFLALLSKAEARGRQATGLIYVFENGSNFCMKSPAMSSLAADFIPYRENVRALLGHTRHSTGGAPKDNENNHPHQTMNWALVHNGSCWTTVPDEDLELKTKCDTEEFVRMFELKAKENKGSNLSNILTESFDEMNGSWSLAFVNKKSGEIFLTTNGRSPLSCVYFPKGMFFASSESYLNTIDRYDTKRCEDGVFLGASIKKSDGMFKDTGIDKAFDPDTHKVYRVNSEARLEIVCAYKDTTYKHKSYANNWRNDEYYNDYTGTTFTQGYHRNNRGTINKIADTAASVDLDLLTEKEWKEHVGKLAPSEQCRTEKELFEHYASQLDIMKVDFDIDTLDFEIQLDLTTDVIEKLALYLVENTPALFDLNYGQAHNLSTCMSNGSWVTPPSLISKLIRKRFNERFTKDLLEFIKVQKYKTTPDYVWGIIEEGKDETNASEFILEYTSWETQVLAIAFGIAFDDTSLHFPDDERWNNPINRPALMEDEPEENKRDLGNTNERELPDSKYACTSCLIKRKVKLGATGVEHHICNRCGTVLIEYPNMNRIN